MTVCGQMFMKIGGGRIKAEGVGFMRLMFAYAGSPYVLIGFALSAVAAFLWTYALSKFEFSYATLIASTSYIFIIFISLFVFKEYISPLRWAGCVLIMAGVLLVLKSR